MKIRILVCLLVITLLLTCSLSRCKKASNSTNKTDTVTIDSESNTNTVDKDGDNANNIDGTIDINDFESNTDINSNIESINSNSNDNTTTSVDTSIEKVDTSEMDFSFDEEDINTDTTPSETAIEISEKSNNTITSGGTYTLSGNITDTMITIDASESDVILVLSGVNIKNSNGPAIYVRSADKVTITLAEGTTNTISDGSSYSLTDSNSTIDATIFSKADMTINGSGSLILNGNYKHGIVSKDDLIISSGTLNITSKNVGLNGKDCVKINSGSITINAGSDGIRSDNTEDTSRGYVYLYGGTVNITAGNDGIQAETVINIENVNLTVKTAGGSSTSLSSSTESYKGLKATKDIYITGGTFNLNTKDDCIHSNGTITISGGTYTLSSGDDGVHADTDLAISGASTKLTINKSYEGLEATNIVISDGNINIVATDDGINAAGGKTTTSTNNRPGRGSFSSSNGSIKITGGTIYIKMCGDGIDANGTVTMTGGYITISGAITGDTSILDYDTTGTISGGTFIGAGSSSMAQNFGTSSTQGSILVKVSGKAGTEIKLTDSKGNVIVTHTPEQAFSCLIISAPGISKGNTYTLTVGSSNTTITMTSNIYSSGGSGGGSFGPRGR